MQAHLEHGLQALLEQERTARFGRHVYIYIYTRICVCVGFLSFSQLLDFFVSFNADRNDILPATVNPDGHAGTPLDAHVHRSMLINKQHPG